MSRRLVLLGLFLCVTVEGNAGDAPWLGSYKGSTIPGHEIIERSVDSSIQWAATRRRLSRVAGGSEDPVHETERCGVGECGHDAGDQRHKDAITERWSGKDRLSWTSFGRTR